MRHITLVIFLLVAILVSACAPSAPPPTPTKTPIPLATVAPTAEPTEAPPSAPTIPSQLDLSGIVLASTDLPAGFQAAPPETMAPIAEGFTQAPFFDVAGTSGFTVAHPEGPELIVTFSGTFTEDDPLREDAPATQKPLYALYMFVFGAGTQEIIGDGQLEGLEGIGQEAQGYFGLADLNDQTIRVDLVVFLRGRTGIYVFHLYPQGWTPAVSVITLARQLDARLNAAVNNQ